MNHSHHRINSRIAPLRATVLAVACIVLGCGDDPFTALREQVGAGSGEKNYDEFGFVVFHMRPNTDKLVNTLAKGYELKPETAIGIDSLKISDCDFTGKSLDQMKQMAHFKRLLIEKCRGFTGEYLEEIRGQEQFIELSIADCRLQQHYLSELTSLPNLEQLTLSHINDDGFKHVGKLRGLTNLTLIDCELGNAGLKDLANLQKLDYLNLYRCDMRDSAVLELRSVLPRCVVRRDETGRTHRPSKN